MAHEEKPNRVFYLNPKQVHPWENVKDLRGYILVFTGEFLVSVPHHYLLQQLKGIVHTLTEQRVFDLDDERYRETILMEESLRAELSGDKFFQNSDGVSYCFVSHSFPGQGVTGHFAEHHREQGFTQPRGRGGQKVIGISSGPDDGTVYHPAGMLRGVPPVDVAKVSHPRDFSQERPRDNKAIPSLTTGQDSTRPHPLRLRSDRANT